MIIITVSPNTVSFDTTFARNSNQVPMMAAQTQSSSPAAQMTGNVSDDAALTFFLS